MIGNAGVKYLVKMDLPILNKLSIGNRPIIQIIVKLAVKGSNISWRVDGQTFTEARRAEFIANVNPLVQRRVIKALVEKLTGSLLD